MGETYQIILKLNTIFLDLLSLFPLSTRTGW